MKRAQIIQHVAAVSGYKQKDVEKVLSAFFTLLPSIVNSGEPVQIKNFASFNWVERAERKFRVPNTGRIIHIPARRGLKITFSSAYKRSLPMEKYGVELNQTKIATETKPNQCPWCQELLDDAGLCPVHGSEPFEDNNDDFQKEDLFKEETSTTEN